jgi:tetratricopeptide (TPR) repeat protein
MLLANINAIARQYPGSKTVISNVNIISVQPHQPQLLSGQDVFIENGRIKKITGHLDGNYKGYTVIDGTGKYLIPGMADMHVHLPRPSSDIQSHEFYLLNLLNGFTTVRQMRGKPADLPLRDSIRSGLMLGCNTYISTPPGFWDEKHYDGRFFTAAMCRDSLAKFKRQGYDFIKYLGGLNMQQYDTLVSIADSLGLRVTGHAPRTDLEKAVNSNQLTIEHVEPYVRLYQKDSVLFWKTIDKMIEKKLYNCPDLVWYIIQGPQTAILKKQTTYGTRLLGADKLDTLTSREMDYYMAEYRSDPVQFAKNIIYDSTQVAIYKYLLPRMHQRGLRLLIGSCPGGFMVPGSCTVTEMKLFVEAGISPYETIKCATYNAARCLGHSTEWGSISEGKTADLVLLGANPLDDIDNIKKVEATILHGRVLTHQYLSARLEQLRKNIAKNNATASLQHPHLSVTDSIKAYAYWDSANHVPLFSQQRQMYLDSALAIIPWHAWWWQQKSMPLLKQRKYEIGMVFVDSAVKYDPAKWLDYRAYIKCIFQKSFNDAISDFRKARDINGNSGVMDHSYDFYTGLCYLQLDRFDSAGYYIDKSIEQVRKRLGDSWVNSTEWFYMGIVEYEKQYYQRAIKAFDKALAIYKNFSDAKYYKAICYLKLKRTNDAYELMQQADSDFRQGYTIIEDGVIYERFPYQVDQRYYINNMLKYLREELKVTKG